MLGISTISSPASVWSRPVRFRKANFGLTRTPYRTPVVLCHLHYAARAPVPVVCTPEDLRRLHDRHFRILKNQASIKASA